MHTTVVPLDGEDIARPCEYELAVSNGIFRAVFVIFERGQDIQHFYEDPKVRSFAQQHRLAMMMPRHCASKRYEDMDIDPANGLARSLFAALNQFASQTNHPELKTAPIILLGFSGAGAFAARLVAFAPQRIAAAVLANAGQFDPLGLDTIQLPAVSLTVPELILVGGKDTHVGTERPHAYFAKSWSKGAPWLFAVQNNVSHCCVLNAKDLILTWLSAVLNKRLAGANGGLASLNKGDGFYAFMELRATDTHDTWGLITSNGAKPLFEREVKNFPQGYQSAGWLPSRRTAQEWKKFVAQPAHSLASQP